ncbi:MAG: sulfatase [Dysgonamonadaceae bacterium]|jgi:uncharacterized sulfatase|nr:sulfatase [Dysgonamonadaceae bacterium]
MFKRIKYTSFLLSGVCLGMNSCAKTPQQEVIPNILFIIADDISYPFMSAYGSRMVSTPGFDYVASRGTLFRNAYVTSPGSSPSRASTLTGLFPWQLEEAGTHASSFSAQFETYPDILVNLGWHVGYTGKGWLPGDWQISGRKNNPAGPEYNEHQLVPPYSGISRIDYTANFKAFLETREPGQPFCFWIGTLEPHRPFEKDSWKKAGLSLEDAEVPGFLPDTEVIRGDLLDFAVEVAWFDSHIVNSINILKEIGEFDNTIIIITGDNGMAFPRAKANLYNAGINVPLAIAWGDNIKPNQVNEALVSMIDIFPTLMDAIGIETNVNYVGRSLLPLLRGNDIHRFNTTVFAGRERHSYARYNNKGYPMRAAITEDFMLIHNFHPGRFPAGDPQEKFEDGTLGEMHHAYADIDASPSKDELINNRNNPLIHPYFLAAMGKRPEFELFCMKTDRDCMNNLADNSDYAEALAEMKEILHNKLRETNDSRMGDTPHIWDSYPRLAGRSRMFPPHSTD